MDCLVQELEDMNIFQDEMPCWAKWIGFVCRLWVPERPVGLDRPCEEKDFRDYRSTVNRDLQNIRTRLLILIQNRDSEKINIDADEESVRNFVICLLVLIGEHSEKNVWNNAESVSLAQDLTSELCKFCRSPNLSIVLTMSDDKFLATLMALRPKLLKDTWKKFPAAVACYKWLLQQVGGLYLSPRALQILPTALIIFDDFVPENRIIGLECIRLILHDSETRQELMKNGYIDVIYDALECLSHQRDVRYILPLYASLSNVLATIDSCANSMDNFEWTKRDTIIMGLLSNMESEQNLELRCSYMLSLPQLVTNVGCAKWFDYLTRILSEYCDRHNDLRTLKATLQAAQTILPMFPLSVLRRCDTLYTAFLKLRCDLTETPVFDREINQLLDKCTHIIYKVAPNIGATIMYDDRVRSITDYSFNFACFDDKYCN
ncbi:TELO2-interacting protein 2-like [Venturia canescens]|uniref:TELO2-interacting protein 2-like n=1 Tax=Venturia canescens TaxID=32260 RepID=UPI001C9CAE85|nr:TELO2-interacting protein 2-like [Venturia canescens]